MELLSILLCLLCQVALLPTSSVLASPFFSSFPANERRIQRSDIVSSISPSRMARLRSSPHRVTPSHTLLSPSLSFSPTPSPLTSASSTLFLPTAYGADPSGVEDSTPAFTALMADLLAANHSHRLANDIVDLGGATVDLQGGDYLISQPVVLPFCYGNVRFQRGTLRASPTFPASSYLLVLGAGPTDKCKATGQDTTMENVAVSEVMLDGQQYAMGCLHIAATMGAVLGLNNFFLGFTTVGITVEGGHEVQILNSWLGQYLYSDPRKEKGHATGIAILGNDHTIRDVVVDSAQIGVYIQGAANLLTNVHTWNQANGNHGVGIHLDCAGYTQNRLTGVYLDWNDLVAVDPQHLVVADSFFLGGGAIYLVASSKNHQINGLSITDNEWDDGGGVAAIQLNQTQAQFTALIDSRIDGNMLDGSYHSTSTSANTRTTVTHSKANNNATYCIDLTSTLLFSQFNLTSVQLTVIVNDLSMGVPASAIVPGKAPGVAAGDMRSLCVAVQFMTATPFVPMADAVEVTFDVAVDQSTYSFSKKNRGSQSRAMER